MTIKALTEDEKRAAINEILVMVYFEWNKEITPELETAWLERLRGIPLRYLKKAAVELAKKKTYGEPKFQDYWSTLLEIVPQKTRYNPWNSGVVKPNPYADNLPPMMRQLVGDVAKKIGWEQ